MTSGPSLPRPNSRFDHGSNTHPGDRSLPKTAATTETLGGSTSGQQCRGNTGTLASGSSYNQGQRFGAGRDGGGRGRGRGRGIAHQRGAQNLTTTAGGRPPRPTHFLALPLQTHAALRAQVAAFQNALFTPDGSNAQPHNSHLVHGLDRSIVIDPMRMHMTLGVMALEPEQDNLYTHQAGPEESTVGPAQRKTISSALALLNSIKPHIAKILGGTKGVMVPLEVMDVLKTERMRPKQDVTRKLKIESREADQVGAGVLFLGPGKAVVRDNERRKLEQVTALIHQSFKNAGFITESRPLTLHCTILNANHRKRPSPRMPFSYSDVLKMPTHVLGLIGAQVSERHVGVGGDPNFSAPVDANISGSSSRRTGFRPSLQVPPPVPIGLGSYCVEEVHLLAMSGRGPNNQYAKCGGIVLQ